MTDTSKPLQASEATPNIGYAPLSLRHRLKEFTQCTIHGFGLLKRRQVATIRNDLKPGVRNQAMCSLGYADWQQPIIFTVQDQRWDGNLGQPIDIVGPKAAPPDLATLQLPGRSSCAALTSKAYRIVNQDRRYEFRSVPHCLQ